MAGSHPRVKQDIRFAHRLMPNPGRHSSAALKDTSAGLSDEVAATSWSAAVLRRLGSVARPTFRSDSALSIGRDEAGKSPFYFNRKLFRI